MNRSSRGRIAGLVLGGLLIFVVGIFSYASIEALVDANRWVVHTEAVQTAAEEMLSRLKDLETGGRGFLLTGDDRFLEPYNSSAPAISGIVERIRTLTADNPAQQHRLDILEPLIAQRMAVAAALIAEKRAGQPIGEARLLRGNALTDRIRAIGAEIVGEEERLLVERDRTAELEAQEALWWIVAGTLASLVIFGTVYSLMHREVRRRQRAETDLERSNAGLEDRVRSRTAELDRQRSFLATVLDSIQSGVYAADVDGRTTLVNRALKQMFGQMHAEQTREQVSAFTEVYTGDGKTRLAPNDTPMARALRGETSRDVELIVLPKDGPARTVIVNAQPMADSASNRLGAVASVEDITERRTVERDMEREKAVREEAEKELRRARRFLDLVVENIPGMLFVKDAKDLRFVLFNRAGEELLGYSRDELIGKNDYDFFPKEQADNFTARDKEVLASGKLQVTPEEPITTRHKGIRVLNTKKMPVADEQGQPLYLLGFSEDISDQKATQAQLRQAQKMEAVGQLTGGIAHDFNNLLGIVVGNLDIALEGMDGDSAQGKLISRALNGALHGAELTRRLMAFARQQSLEPKAFSINDMLPDLVALLKRTLGEAISIRVAPSKDLWPAFADPPQVQDAIVNLAINARDAMPDGGILIIETANIHLDEEYARNHADVKPGDYAMLAVTDSGMGMPPEVVERALEPFFTTKPIGKGTGLGLSMIYGFARQSGGHLKIYSEVGHGTSVKLYLPRAKDGAAVSEPAVSDSQRLPGGAERILVVEDNEDLRDMAVQQLSSLGYRVSEAENGEAALAVLKGSEPIDLLFSDVVMSGRITGHDLVREAKKQRPDIRVLLTTGYAERAVSEGSDWQLLRKPYRKRDLALKVRSVLDQR